MESHIEVKKKIQESIVRLLDYCTNNKWAGFDPFDALNSRIFSRLPFAQCRMGRLVFTQAMKRSPLNFRRILLVPKSDNPKGLSLVIMSLFNLGRMDFLKNDDSIRDMLARMIGLKSPSRPYYCWGYNFDWQSRDSFLPKFEPNIVCTSFAGNALIDAYDEFKDEKYLNIAISAGDFLLQGLNITRHNDELCFSYTPYEWSHVHNANLLGAAFLARLYSITQEKKFVEYARRAVLFSMRRQQEDGSWPYGEDRTQRWIDNFHTGYNLVALKKYSEYTGDTSVEENIKKGLRFYRKNFFADDRIPKYYHNQLYPIDIHAIAYSIITLVEFSEYDEGNIELAERIFTWSLDNMLSEEGYFFYQKKQFYKNRIPYMRWSQAWMLLALSTLLSYLSQTVSQCE